MGSSSSKFRRYLLNGDEYAALEIFHSSSVLRHSLNPNYSYGDSLQHNSPLHLAAKHAMKPLLRIFLNELGGNPNEQNAASETVLHLACQGNHVKSLSTQERRFACVMLILQWQGSHENPNKVHLSAVDNKGDTPLHNAAATGLKKCVEALACHGAPLFIENEASETPCDIAEKNEHEDIAQYLEIKMVFSSDMLANSQESESSSSSEQECTGLRTLDLQEAKDQLLVETSDMLHIPLFTSEVLLRNHEWSRQSLLDTWMQDPVKCCKEAGVEPPTSALHFDVPDNSLSLKVSCQQIQDEYQNESLNSPMRNVPLKDEIICSVCMTFIPKIESPVQVPCHHQFCMSCWKGYLTTRIQDGEVHNILCPEFECHHLIPVGVIEKLVSQDVAKRYLQFDIEAFVGSNPNIQWCPYPGCERAVKLPDTEIVSADLLSSNATTPLEVSHSVDCGNGHYFCWECLGEAHAPCGCEKWKEWHRKILEIKPEELKNTCKETENAANCLWMVTNSKPCPNCKSPIQKNEGCNHMKCSKCKFDYCWVCLEAWKKHSSATGGYFRCNRFDAVQRVEVRTGVLISEAEAHNNHMQELKKFLHYYTRFHENETSYKLEKPFAKLIKKKSEVFRAALTSVAKSEVDLNFFDEAIHELLYARRILCGSFVYGYYLEDNGYNKTIFEYMQCDLKDSTEKLSKMIACNYLQTPCKKIIQATRLVKQKRIDFITAILKGLIPPETPPSMRKSQKRRYPGLLGIDPAEDEQLSQAIMASLEDLDPRNPWVKDPQGRHTNLAAIFDWPDYDEDKEETNSSNMLATNLLGVCTREHCMKPRARNPRTGQIHEYCSLICKYNDLFGKEDEKSSCAEVDFSTELLLALEISKLQMVKDENMEIETATANDSSYMFSGNALGVRVIRGSMEESPGETAEYLQITDELTQASENSATEGAQDDLHRISEATESCNDVVPNTSSLMPSKIINFYLKSPGDANYLNSVNTNDQIQSLKKTEKDLFIFVSNSHSNSASKKTNVDSS